MIVRVVKASSDDSAFIGEFETTNQLPVSGDTFWYGTHGPYTVVERAFAYKKDPEDAPAHDVILTVKELSKTQPPTALFGTQVMARR